MIDRLPRIIKELATELDTPLHPDRIGACKLNINEELHIQLECDAHEEKSSYCYIYLRYPSWKIS